MKIVKPLTLCAMHKPYRFGGRDHLAVTALGFFRLGADNPRFLSENLEWPKVLKSLPAGQPFDEAMPKPQAEALLLGRAFAPGATPCTELAVQMCVGAIDKTLLVTGERAWQAGLGGRLKVAGPAPFSVMPLGWERAAGGPGQEHNPLGCGPLPWSRRALAAPGRGCMPNLSYPDRRRAGPAGFGPVPQGWAPRKHQFGTYKRRWLREEAPGFASDLDWNVFNLAPPDQRSARFFDGGEAYCLRNLHPTLPVIRGRLPQLRARAFVLGAGQDSPQAREVALQIDTVWFLPEFELGVMVYHGQTGIADSDALDVAALMVAYETALAPRSAAYYRGVLGLRLHPHTGPLHAFDENQLCPGHAAEELARRAVAHAQAEAAELALRQARMDEMDASFWQEHGGAPAGHAAPRAEPLQYGLPSAAMIDEGQFDLVATVAQAQALGAQAEARAAAARAELEAMPAPTPEPEAPGQALAAAIERAAVPAYDLLDPAHSGADPRLAPVLQALAASPAAGAQEQAARAALLGSAAQRRAARRAAPEPSVAALPLAPACARGLGLQVRQWLAEGACLAGRDLAGADLAGADFSGADLREVMLEGADLSGARFAGADLRRAVLCGACLDGADFTGARLNEANLSAGSALAATFAGCDLSDAQAIGASWPRARLGGARLDRLAAPGLVLRSAVLDGASLLQSLLAEAQADDSSWQGAVLEQAVLMGASLQGSDWRGARLTRTVLIDAALRASRWDGASWNAVHATGKADWQGASLRELRARLCGLHGNNLSHTDLSGAQLVRCDLGRCSLEHACLDGGLLSYSLFNGASLRCASARQADFYQALCRKSDFCGADLAGASFAEAELGFATGMAPAGRPA